MTAAMEPVQAWAETVSIPTYAIGQPDRNPMFLEKRVYQGSSGVVYPYPVIDRVFDEKKDRPYTAVFWVGVVFLGILLPLAIQSLAVTHRTLAELFPEDEAQFGPTADTFDVGRDPNHHLAFGFGAHYCIGAALARMEVRLVLDELLDRFTGLEPAGEVAYSPSDIIAGVTSAPVCFR